MGTKNNPGKFDCYANAEPDSPAAALRTLRDGGDLGEAARVVGAVAEWFEAGRAR
jgi:hypothetical protein